MKVLGEITTKAKVDYVQVVKNTLKTIGYEDEENGIVTYSTTMPYSISLKILAIDYRTCHVFVAIQTQAPDIAQKVHEGKADEDVGAGDQVNISLLLDCYNIIHLLCVGNDVWLCDR